MIFPIDGDKGIVIADLRDNQKLGAWLSLARTVFVTIVLGGGAMLFSGDVNDLVVEPIESMLKKV